MLLGVIECPPPTASTTASGGLLDNLAGGTSTKTEPDATGFFYIYQPRFNGNTVQVFVEADISTVNLVFFVNPAGVNPPGPIERRGVEFRPPFYLALIARRAPDLRASKQRDMW